MYPNLGCTRSLCSQMDFKVWPKFPEIFLRDLIESIEFDNLHNGQSNQKHAFLQMSRLPSSRIRNMPSFKSLDFQAACATGTNNQEGLSEVQLPLPTPQTPNIRSPLRACQILQTKNGKNCNIKFINVTCPCGNNRRSCHLGMFESLGQIVPRAELWVFALLFSRQQINDRINSLIPCKNSSMH